MKKQKKSPLDELLSAVPARVDVTVNDVGFRREIEIKRPGRQQLTAHVQKSNSGDTCCVALGRYAYYAEWDEAKVTAQVLFAFWSEIHPDESLTRGGLLLEGKAMRELRTRGPRGALTGIPQAVTDVVAAVRTAYEGIRGEDGARLWAEVRLAMTKLLKRGATEPQILEAWRETLVREVQES